MSESNETRSQVRGSALLIAGRVISLGLNFSVQVLIVRALSKSDFGAFAFGLAVVAVLTNLNLLGLSKAIGRALAAGEEHRDPAAQAGVLLSGLGAVLGFGAFIVCAVLLGAEFLQRSVVSDAHSVALLMWLIFLVPLQAMDNIFQSVAAVFLGARPIFYRRHIVGPALKLASVLIVLAVEGDTTLLCLLYVLATTAGVALYVRLLWQALGERGIRRHVARRDIRWPGTSLLLLAGPLLATDLVIALESNLAILLLEGWHGTEAVAALRAIIPLVGLVYVVSEGFKFLYMPLATRLIERGDKTALGAHYWRSFRWIMVFTLPIAVTLCTFAEPIVALLFGDRYIDSATLLVVMTPIQFATAALILNHYTLTALNRGRWMMWTNGLGLLSTLGLTLLLTPAWGALGAAVAIAVALLLHYGAQYFGLRGSGVGAPTKSDIVLTMQAFGLLAVLLLAREVWEVSHFVMASLALLGLSVVTLWNIGKLELESFFPELANLPVLRRLVYFRRPQ